MCKKYTTEYNAVLFLFFSWVAAMRFRTFTAVHEANIAEWLFIGKKLIWTVLDAESFNFSPRDAENYREILLAALRKATVCFY